MGNDMDNSSQLLPSRDFSIWFRGTNPTLCSEMGTMNKGWPSRALHLPGHSDCFRDGSRTQRGLIIQQCMRTLLGPFGSWHCVYTKLSQCVQSSCYHMERACLRIKPMLSKTDQWDGKRPSPFDRVPGTSHAWSSHVRIIPKLFQYRQTSFYCASLYRAL